MPTDTSTPSWVFSYLPTPTPTPTTKPIKPTPPSSSTASTPTFLTTLHKALFTPKLDAEQERIATLQGMKASLEQQIAFRQRAGLSTRDLEREQIGRVEDALRGLEKGGE